MTLSFNGFLTEAKNLHLEHLEDEVLNNGVGGTSANAGIKLYVDGVEQGYSLGGSGTYVAMENLGADVWIGRLENSYAGGKIDEVAIWNTALRSWLWRTVRQPPPLQIRA